MAVICSTEPWTEHWTEVDNAMKDRHSVSDEELNRDASNRWSIDGSVLNNSRLITELL